MNEFCDINQINSIFNSFLRSYKDNQNKELSEWLPKTMQQHLPDSSIEELQGYTSEIVDNIKIAEDKKESLNEYLKTGKTSGEWFHKDLQNSLSYLSAQDTAKFLGEVDRVINDANKSFAEAMLRNDGKVNGNPNLNGNIAEHYHADTYNINAAAQGKIGNAQVKGNLTKNSVDVTIGQKHYQMKYGKDAKATIQMIKKGNYKGQVIVVPKDQVEEVQKAFPNRKVVPAIGNKRLHSNGLTKAQAKQLQEDVQNGKLDRIYDWNAINNKDLVIGISKNVGKAGIMGAATGGFIEAYRQIKSNQDADISEVVKASLKGGADFGIKALTACALKVSAEKGSLLKFAKGTSADVFANIAFVGIENTKTLIKLGKNEITPTQATDRIANTTISTAAAIIVSKQGKRIGAKIGEKFGTWAAANLGKLGAVFGPHGAAIGTVAGTIVGYAAGSKIGEMAYNGVKKVANSAKSIGKNILEKGREIRNRIRNKHLATN